MGASGFSWTWAGACALLVGAALGCGDDGSKGTTDTKQKICSPGVVYECPGPRACRGRQFCKDDGTDYLACFCDTDTAGSGGTGGTDADGGSLGDAGPTLDAGTLHDAQTPDVDASSPTDGGATQVEICDNGKDDDHDGKIDCADDACAALSCVAAAPKGFKGPVALYVGGDAATQCTGDYDEVALNGGTAATGTPATCSACDCTAATSCATFLDVRMSAANSCGTGASCTMSTASSCGEISASCLSGQATITLQAKLPADVASCKAPKQAAQKADPSWALRALACSAPLGAGCSTGEVCAPALPDGFGPKRCVYKSGDVACPAQIYTDKRVYFSQWKDTRSCTACGCTDSGCSYGAQLFDDADSACGSSLLSLTPDQCAQVIPTNGKVRVGVSITGAPACQASGGQPSGDVADDKPVTVCCEP